MPCFKPVDGWRAVGGGISFDKKKSTGFPMQVSCGQCMGCRLARSKEWAIRMTHEAQMHDENTFITLTYSDNYLPHDGSVDVRHFQLFMKRLRKQFNTDEDGRLIKHHDPRYRKIRFFHCGEYGDRFDRPHYHAVLFGVDFPDKTLFYREDDRSYWKSEILDKVWKYGHCLISDVTFESCAYVSRYVTKKVTGKDAEWYYTRTDEYGVLVNEVRPEYCTMSRRPGIGETWFREFHGDVYPYDEVVARGHPNKPPRYYDKLLQRMSERDYEEVKLKRKQKQKILMPDCTPARLKDREKCLMARVKQLHRSYENGP